MPSSAEATTPPRVLFAFWQSHRSSDGGVRSLSHIIKRLGHVRPVVATNGESAITRELRARGVPIHHLIIPPASKDLWRRPAEHVRSAREATRLIRALRPAAVHANDIRSFWTFAPAARPLGTPVFLNIRDVKPPGDAYGIRWRVARSLAHEILVLTDEMKDAVERRIPPLLGVGAPVRTVRSVVDADFVPNADARPELRRELGLPADAAIVLYVGAIMPKKAQLELLEAWAGKLREAAFTLVFAGDVDSGSRAYGARIREFVEARGLSEKVRFLGFRDDVRRLFQAADVTLLASRREGWARCMVESLACGTPVVSFDVCSAKETLEVGDAGIVAPQGDYERLWDSVSCLLRDDERRRASGARGREQIRRLCDPGAVVERYEARYRAALP